MDSNNEQKNEQKNQEELEINKKNREDYENLMSESSTKLDGYWDSNNIFVKLLLFGLAAIIVIGVIYYVTAYLNK